MRCLIVEDEAMAVKVLESHIRQLPDLEIVGVHYNAMDALADLQRRRVDLLFLDIQMPKLSGLSLLKSLHRLPPVILTTAYREYALDGFELDVVDYLLKPISFERFVRAVHKVYRLQPDAFTTPPPEQQNAKAEPGFIYIKHQRTFTKILLDDIIYLESIKNHVRLVTTNETYLPLISLSELAQKLPSGRFVRIHRSFIVALAHVQQYTTAHVHTPVKVLPIGRQHKEEVLRRLGDFVV